MESNCTFGYHGTVKSKANLIMQEHRFLISQKNTEWLGRGIYFFAYLQDSIDWAEMESKKRKNENCGGKAVLKAELLFGQDELLDLDDQSQLDELNSFFNEYLEKAGEKEAFDKNDKQYQLKASCLACNLYREFVPSIKAISYTFRRRDKGAAEFYRNQKQICMKDNDCIGEIEEVEINGEAIR